MTTGCGRRCQFCLPDLNPQIDLPKDKIMGAVRANVREGNKQISLATEDMFIWGQVHTETPFYFPNREALLDLYSRDRQHAGRRAACAQPLRRSRRRWSTRCSSSELSERAADKSPIHLPLPEHAPGEEGARRRSSAWRRARSAMAKQIMPSKGVPFPIDEWPSVVLQGLDVLNENNWFPVMTLIIGNPGETDEDVRGDARPGLRDGAARAVRVLHPVDLHAAPRHAHGEEAGRHRDAAADALQWQLMMKCWKMNLRPGQYSWWGPTAWRLGALGLWAVEAAEDQRPGIHLAAVDVRERAAGAWMGRMGKIYVGRPLRTKTRRELLATVKPSSDGLSGQIPGTCRTTRSDAA